MYKQSLMKDEALHMWIAYVHGATKWHCIFFYHSAIEYYEWGTVTWYFQAVYTVTPYEEGIPLFYSSDALPRGMLNEYIKDFAQA